MFGIIPKPLWVKKTPADELNRILLSLRVLMIKKEDKVILIDSGIGDYHDKQFNDRFAITSTQSPLIGLLREAFNLGPENITDIILTHLHFDHVGGLGTYQNHQPQLLFPNATIHLHRAHYQYALNPTKRDQGSFQKEFFLPWLELYQQQRQIHWLEGKEGVILPEMQINFRVSHGHTPYLVHPYDEKFIYMADLVPTSHHVKIPWVMGYDIHPGQTTIDKEELYPFIYQQNLTMIFEHDPKVWGAQLGSEKDEVSQLFNTNQETSWQKILAP